MSSIAARRARAKAAAVAPVVDEPTASPDPRTSYLSRPRYGWVIDVRSEALGGWLTVTGVYPTAALALAAMEAHPAPEKQIREARSSTDGHRRPARTAGWDHDDRHKMIAGGEFDHDGLDFGLRRYRTAWQIGRGLLDAQRYQAWHLDGSRFVAADGTDEWDTRAAAEAAVDVAAQRGAHG